MLTLLTIPNLLEKWCMSVLQGKIRLKGKKSMSFPTFSCHKPAIIQQTPTDSSESPSKTSKKKKDDFQVGLLHFTELPENIQTESLSKKMLVRGVDKFSFIF